jgi:hypothetical protein
MLKNICKSIALIIIVISIFFIVQYLKKSHLKESIIKEINSQTGIKYNISDNIRRCVRNGHMSCDSEKMPSCYKLVYETDFDCSKCLIDMKEIHNFYIELSNIREIEFCLITTIKSYGYIKFHLDQSLGYYDLWVVQQEFTDDNIKLYLIDTLNDIVMAGDITIYPFLKDEYIRRLKNEK